MNKKQIATKYKARHASHLVEMASNMQKFIETMFKDVSYVDTIRCRAKSVESFINKASKQEIDKRKMYDDPINQIQDQIGARVVVYYTKHISVAEGVINDYFTSFEEEFKEPTSPHEFGYVGKHFILGVPLEILGETIADKPRFFELQIKTLFQHAWGQANHDLCYKTNKALTTDQKRKVAYTAAQAWGADSIYSELSNELS